MSEDDNHKYNLRRGKRSRPKEPRKSLKQIISNRKKPRDFFNDEENFTNDGYLDDGFVVSDEDIEDDIGVYFDIDSKPIQNTLLDKLSERGIRADPEVIEEVFRETGSELFQPYFNSHNSKPNDQQWKCSLSETEISKLSPELKRIRGMIEEETPTIPKILNANITTDDKKRCIKLFDQLNNMDPYTPDHDKKVEQINNIIRKGKKYTKSEIKRLEAIEARLKQNAIQPDTLKNQILLMDADDKVKAIHYGEYLEMQEHEIGSQSYNALKEELEWGIKIPHKRIGTSRDLSRLDNHQLNLEYSQILEELNEELFGMDHIKKRMLQIINDRRTSGGACGRNIAIVGPPGTGKTQIAKALAKVIRVPYEKISLAGLKDAGTLTGHNKVFQSSGPSIVLQILSRLQSNAAVVIFDEVDKLGETSEGREVQYGLLRISDYVHNNEFRDQYLSKYPHDLSKVLFIYIMNKTEGLDPALLSRMDLIYTQPYNDEEKKIITRNYVLPRALRSVGMNKGDVILDNKAIKKIITDTTTDPGVRDIEKSIKKIIGEINMYRSVVLSDGTTGKLDLGYTIPNFRFPLKINHNLLIKLTGNNK